MSQQGIYVLCYRTQLEKLTFNYCKFLSSARPLAKEEVLKCISFKLSVRACLGQGGSRPPAKGKPNYVMGVWVWRPQWGPGAKPLVRGQRDEVPLKLITFLYFRN